MPTEHVKREDCGSSGAAFQFYLLSCLRCLSCEVSLHRKAGSMGGLNVGFMHLYAETAQEFGRLLLLLQNVSYVHAGP